MLTKFTTNSPPPSPKNVSKDASSIGQSSEVLGGAGSSVGLTGSRSTIPLLKSLSGSSAVGASDNIKAVGGKLENITLSPEYVIKRNCKKNELNFYTQDAQKFSGIVPEVKSVDTGRDSIVLYNIARNMQTPIFLDVKVGGTFEDSFYLQNRKGLEGDKLNNKLQQRQDKNKQTGADQNFFWVAGSSKQSHQDKYRNRQDINSKGLSSFMNKHFMHNSELAKNVASKVDQLLDKLNESKCALAVGGNAFAFVASSLLIAYDENDPTNMDMRIIDFDQSWKAGESDADKVEEQESIDRFNSIFNKGLNTFKDYMANVNDSTKFS